MLYYTYDTIKYCPYTSVNMYPNDAPHILEFWKITYAINGKAVVVTNGVKRTLSNAALLFVRPGDIHQNLQYSPANEYKHRDIYISDERLRQICAFLPIDPYEQLKADNVFLPLTNLHINNFEFILNSFPTNSPEKSDYLATLHTAVIVNILSLFIEMTANNLKPPAWLTEIAEKTTFVEYLQNDVSYLLKDTPYSHGHICREFKKYYGRTLYSYLNRAKIVHSSTLLMDKKLSITDIAYRLGFSTQSSFIKSFKYYFGVSPGAWRKTYLRDKDSSATEHWGQVTVLP